MDDTSEYLNPIQLLTELDKQLPANSVIIGDGGACLLTFRRNFLKDKTVGVVPAGGYRWRDNQSHVAAMWLVSEEKKRGVTIKTTYNGREV
ncbi:hypothetical protein J437_LFUL019270 [Ladona fulva]|uniref:Uncharacterized protein n=1 Tax=Ladona fulva TaxID=123851 RepID=A0A8K0KSA3_LADFU|nr:hypothetical protein J437_LFUL019270 [Ladona fulva]